MHVRNMATRLLKRAKLQGQKGFTLLELLVVVAILAIIAGGMAVAYSGLESQSAKGEASHGIAGIDSAVRTFTSVRRAAPSNLDSLLAATPGDGTQSPATITGGELIKTLSAGKLANKLQVATLTAAQQKALVNAGITKLRYIDAAGNVDTDGVAALTTTALDGTAASVDNIKKADIPARIFDAPREGSGKNRGRGYTHALAAADAVAVWKAGAGNVDIIKLGAKADDVLVAFGLGNNATMYEADRTAVGDVTLASAPSYQDVAKSEYGRYILLYNLGSAADPYAKAKLQAVVDAKGDFLDEELAEYSGQKQ